jgi:murein DD-endopeptidase MepM/ murein hydrolase activator NlpD
VSKGRSLVGRLLALCCLGVLLIPNILIAKTTKRSARATKPRVAKAERPARAVAPVSAKGRAKATVAESRSSRSAATRSGVDRRASARTAAAKKGVRGRYSKRLARTKRSRTEHASQGGRGDVDEHIHVRKGDTVENLLAARGMGMAEAREWIAAAADVFDLTRIRPRHGLTLRFDRATRELDSLRYEIDGNNLLVVEAAADGITARLEDLPYFVEVKGIAGQITRGLREDTVAAGVPARIAADIADIFGWDVDVESGLRPGDEFRVIYENIWQVGLGKPQAGKVLAAELVLDGKRQTAVLFENEDGEGGYYRPTGEAISRRFLRYPVEFSEISSEFSLERFHPIRRRWRPHWGVDFAAPYGTPVRAAADGVVAVSGWENGLGKTVRIAHADGIGSAYGHLSEIAPSVREGGPVERGQVIGYVGSTGLSTGPHLHYEIQREGEHVDPLEFNCDRENAIDATLVKQFGRAKNEVTRQLASLPRTNEPTSLSLSTSLFQATE